MKKPLAILSIVFFASPTSAWELFGLNENTKLENLEILEETYSDYSYIFYYHIVPPKPVPIANEYVIVYSKAHGICSVGASVDQEAPYPYGADQVQVDISSIVSDDWAKLKGVLVNKYGDQDSEWFGPDVKMYGFSEIKLRMPEIPTYFRKFSLSYKIDNPKCENGAKKDAADKNGESIGVSSDDF